MIKGIKWAAAKPGATDVSRHYGGYEAPSTPFELPEVAAGPAQGAPIVPWCQSCDRTFHAGVRTRRPAVAWWTVWNDGGYPVTWPVCQTTLDRYFDNADDDPDLEPVRVEWIDGSRVLCPDSPASLVA